MKKCPKCNQSHNKPGTFCSRSCANTRERTDEIKRKISEKVKASQKYRSGVAGWDRKKAAVTRKANYAALTANRIETLPFEELNSREKRKRILIEQSEKCSECPTSLIWYGKPLKLELDHIDGDRSNNHRSNLRLVCPNCHSQTSTYKSSNNPDQGRKKVSDSDLIEILKRSSSIRKALQMAGMNFQGGNYTRCRRLIVKHGLDLNLLL